LLLALTTACVARGEYDARTWNLTQLFGIESADQVLPIGADRVCVVSCDSYGEGSGRRLRVTATFIDIARKLVLGKAQLGITGKYVGFRINGGNVCFDFSHYWEDTDTFSLEKAEITPDGEIQTRFIDRWERDAIPMPGGGWILTDDDGNLCFRAEEAAEPRVLLSGNPYYPSDEEDPGYSEEADFQNRIHTMRYSFYQALDDYRFIYHLLEYGKPGSCGVYDLRAGSGLLLSGSGRPERIHEDTLYTNTSVIDLNTFAITTLPTAIRNVSAGLEWDVDTDNQHDFSPEMRILCELDAPWKADFPRLSVYNVETGELLEVIALDTGKSWELAGFPAEDAVVLYGTSYENQDVYLHMIHLESALTARER